MRSISVYRSLGLSLLLLAVTHRAVCQSGSFDCKGSLFNSPSTITLTVTSVNVATGAVTINGGDSRAPTTPFVWKWAEEGVTTGFFPQSHTYTDRTKGYIVQVTASY
jgi:hypothetical protein